MNSPDALNKVFSSLKSKKRTDIIRLLIRSEQPLLFNEISKTLSIPPSTLEYHLKQLEQQDLISHVNNSYTRNAYTKLIWNEFNSLKELDPLIEFLKNHKLPDFDANLMSQFIYTKPALIPDIISLLSLIKEVPFSKLSLIRLAGTFNLEMEENVMRLGDLKMEIGRIEMISTYQDFIDFINYENFEYFLSFTPLENIQLYMIEQCDYYMGIGDDFGILFLLDLDNNLDFHQCLFFEGAEKASWLNSLFESIKKSAKQVNLTQGFLKDKLLFKKYLEQLKKGQK